MKRYCVICGRTLAPRNHGGYCNICRTIPRESYHGNITLDICTPTALKYAIPGRKVVFGLKEKGQQQFTSFHAVNNFIAFMLFMKQNPKWSWKGQLFKDRTKVQVIIFAVMESTCGDEANKLKYALTKQYPPKRGDKGIKLEFDIQVFGISKPLLRKWFHFDRWVVYGLIDQHDNSLFYVGQTRFFEGRIQQHKGNYCSPQCLIERKRQAIQGGLPILAKVLALPETQDGALVIERELIQRHAQTLVNVTHNPASNELS